MFRKISALIGFILVLSTIPKFTFASHVSGGEITYTALGLNQYKVVFVAYWDCSAFDPGTSQQMTADNTCGFPNLSFTVNLDTAYEISQICPSSINQTSCNGGTLPGNKKNVYSAIITLPGACSEWTFAHNSCCRNNSVNLGTTQPDYTFYATLNNLAAPDNNSPYFTSQPLPYMCVNQPVCYSPGVVELDGHTLSYSFVNAMDVNSTTPVVYVAGYSGTSPMPGMTISPTTGLISFTPTMVGNFVVSFLVTEKNAAGVIIGTVIRDIQMVVVSCTNQVIPCNSGGIFNLTGNGATPTGPNSMQICENIPFSFQVSFTDPNAANILSFTSNIAEVLDSSVITSFGTNPVIINVSWEAPAGSAGWNTTFALTISDNACPVTGQQTVNYFIDVLSATNAGPDMIKCGNQGVLMHGMGPGNIYNWSVISGPPLVVGTNFSCNPCQDPLASPDSTTTYLLTCNGGNGCLVTDTVTINVVPDFNYNITQSATSSCLLQPIQLGIANLSPSGPGFSYQWSPATYLSSTTIDNPVATITSPGSYDYSVVVTNPFGCVKKDSLTLSVIPAVSPVITAHADTSFCPGSTASLNVTFGNGVPATCGLSATGGCASTTPLTVGTGTLTTNSYPTAFSGLYEDGRIQILYTAAELNALGFVGGKITSIALNVAQKNSTAPYIGFTIKMGCTNLSSLPNTMFQAVSTVVYGPISTSTILGWNIFNFATPYEWDGISNLIVAMCYNNTDWTSNDKLYKTATTFASVVNDYEDAVDGCTLSLPNTSVSQMERPNTRFTTCAVSANPASYSYQWAPASGNIANASIKNTTAQPTTSTTFTVTVTDIVGQCSTTDTVQVDVVSINTLSVTQAGPFCVNAGPVTLQASVPVGTGIWSGPGITNPNSGIFDPAIALVGAVHKIYYTVSGTCGNAIDSMNIEVIPQPDVTINPVPDMCISDPAVTLVAATPGGVWSGPGVDAVTGVFTPANAGLGNNTISYTITNPCPASTIITINVISNYNATITGAPSQICMGVAAITLTSDPGGIWSGNGITDPVAGTYDPNIAGAGLDTIIHTFLGGCGSADTVTINVIDLPQVSFTSDLAPGQGCAPQLVNFNSGVSPLGGTYSWNFGDPASGTFNTSNSATPQHTYASAGTFDVSLTYTNSGCSKYFQQVGFITIYTILDATIDPQHVASLCASDLPIQLLPLVVPGGTWSGTGITDPVTGTFDPQTAGPGVWTITYTLSGACGDAKSTTMTVIATPVINFSVDKDQGCQPQTISFTPNLPGGTYAWDFGDPESGTLNTSTFATPSHIFEDSRNYGVKLTYTIPPGCVGTFTDSIFIHSQPEAVITSGPQPTTIVSPEIHFSSEYSTGQIDNWTWIIDTMATFYTPSASYTFSDSGTFADTLIVSNNFGCIDTSTSTVIIDGILAFYSPNAFTPNGDGRNDVFTVQGDGIDDANFEITIYNRWGGLVYKSTKRTEGWNGKFMNSGTPQESAVYVWKVYLKDFQHSKHYYMGHVTLLK